MDLRELQLVLEDTYRARDAERGVQESVLWFMEEVGELAEAVRTGEGLEKEFADVGAWLVSLASLMGVDFDEVMEEIYGKGCPDCGEIPCCCSTDF